jgi:2',3'-cyclic-nucleotide 2'-phosphodiesterase (5'-nucleotidase family)
MKRAAFTFTFTVAIGLSLASCLVQGWQPDLKEQDVRLTVFHTSDWHSRLVPYTYDPPAPIETLGLNPANAPFGGVTRLATLLKRERGQAERHVTLDTGDCFQGAPIFNIFNGEAEIRAQSQVGLDAAVIGNHEFDKGVDNYVDQFGQWGTFAALAANYDLEDPSIPGNKRLGEVAQPYVILNRGGLRIAVIGHGNFSSLNSIGEGGNSIGATPMEHNAVTQLYIDLLAPSVDVIGVITHLGMDYDIGLVEGYRQYIPTSQNPPRNQECIELKGEDTWECKVPPVNGIDFILGGHLHLVLNPPRVPVDPAGRVVPVIHSGAFLQFLGRVDMVFRHASRLGRDDWYGFELVDHRHQIFPIDATIDHDVEMARLMDPYFWELGLDYDLGRPIAFSPSGVTRTASNGGDSALGNVVANAIRTRNLVETDFALTNSAGIRDNLPAGPITAEMLFNVFPFENTITTFFLSGREVQEVFDFVASRSTTRGCRTQVQVSGIEFTMRCDCAVSDDGCCGDGARAFGEFDRACAEDILIDGQPINPNASYEVGANDYMAGGGSGFQMLRRNTTQQDSGISLRTAVEEWMQKQGPCTADDIAPLGVCDQEKAPDSLACSYANLVDRYGADQIACLNSQGLVDGRVQRVLPQ